MTVWRRSLRDAIATPALAEPAAWIYQALDTINPRVALANARYRRNGAPDELPIPPADLRFVVAGTTDISWFLEAGARAAESISQSIAQTGHAVADFDTILDFGCGCGRVLRHWRSLDRTRICGSDYNRRLVDWCNENLSFTDVRTNQLEPPLGYRDSEYNLVYALSVFTHLTAELQGPWMRELTRITIPGGYVVLSAHGEAYLSRLTSEEKKRFAAGQIVVKNNVTAPGSNMCAAYHPTAYVRDQLAAGLDIIDFIPEGAKGNPRQDLYVLRKPEGSR